MLVSALASATRAFVSVLKTKKAQTLAKNVAGRFRKACKQVVDRGGASADNLPVALKALRRDVRRHCLDLLNRDCRAEKSRKISRRRRPQRRRRPCLARRDGGTAVTTYYAVL